MYKSAYGRSTEDNATCRCGNDAKTMCGDAPRKLEDSEEDEREEYDREEDREIIDRGVLVCDSMIRSETEERRGVALGAGIGDLGRCGGDE